MEPAALGQFEEKRQDDKTRLNLLRVVMFETTELVELKIPVVLSAPMNTAVTILASSDAPSSPKLLPLLLLLQQLLLLLHGCKLPFCRATQD